ncbi:MAG: hypothetical protein ACFCVF_07905 [Kineosporiaceae bacterium]
MIADLSLALVDVSANPLNVEGVRQLLLQVLGVGLVVVAIILLFGIKRSSLGDALGILAIVVIALLIAGISIPLITGTSDDIFDFLFN